jgi:hypothetical protein
MAPKLKRLDIYDIESSFSFHLQHTFDELSATQRRVSAKEKAVRDRMVAVCDYCRLSESGVI